MTRELSEYLSFKVGDKVLCIRGQGSKLLTGAVYTIEHILDKSYGVYFYLSGSTANGWLSTRFVKLNEVCFANPPISEVQAASLARFYQVTGSKHDHEARSSEPIADYSVANAIARIPNHTPLQYIQEL